MLSLEAKQGVPDRVEDSAGAVQADTQQRHAIASRERRALPQPAALNQIQLCRQARDGPAAVQDRVRPGYERFDLEAEVDVIPDVDVQADLPDQQSSEGEPQQRSFIYEARSRTRKGDRRHQWLGRMTVLIPRRLRTLSIASTAFEMGNVSVISDSSSSSGSSSTVRRNSWALI